MFIVWNIPGPKENRDRVETVWIAVEIIETELDYDIKVSMFFIQTQVTSFWCSNPSAHEKQIYVSH